MVGPLPTGLAVDRQQRLDLLPLRVGQFVSSHHDKPMPNKTVIYGPIREPSDTL
ncbi:hypothetical protein [Frankia sp. Cr1]|uniref:hypothetical protein n=1 Tax=Frankia sp. Cr1 TaxID=3073931 RepID=UPI002AD4C07B|nr:hypothetical protein [Frankia sp. Cr1]